VLAAALCPAQSWDEVGTGSGSGGGISANATASEYVSMVLLPSGLPVLAWHDRGLHDVWVSAWDGAAWARLGGGAASPAGTDELLSGYPSLAVDSTGAPLVAWVQETTTLSFAVFVRRWDGTAWVEVGSSSASGRGVSQTNGWALRPSLAAAPGGRLLLAWQENTTSDDEILVRHWTGTTWEELGTGSASGGGISHSLGRARYPAVAVDREGLPVVAWLDDGSGAPEVCLRHWDGSAWVEVGPGSASGPGISGTHGGVQDQAAPAIATAPGGAIIVAWTDASSGNAEVYARRWNGTAWVEVGAGSASAGGISSTAGRSVCPALAVTAAGVPVAAWQEDNGAGIPQVWVRRWNGQQWVEAGSGGATGNGVSATAGASRRPALAMESASQQVTVAWDCAVAAGNTDIYLRQWDASSRSIDLPQAAFAGSADPVPDAAETSFTVTYSDELAVAIASLDGDDIVVIGPGGSHANARLVTVAADRADDGPVLHATYAIPAPGGAWDRADNGTYTVFLQAGAVADTAGNWAESAPLGSFAVSLPLGLSLWRLALAGCSPALLEFGLSAEAAAGVDASDLLTDAGPGRAWFEDVATPLARDVRPQADGVEWQLAVDAAGVPVEVAWPALAGLPGGRYLSLYRVDEHGAPVGNSARHLAEAGVLVVPPGELWRLVVRYGPELLFDASLEAGWNLISLPVEPLAGSLDDLFPAAEPGPGDGDRLARDGLRVGPAWTFGPGGLTPVLDLHALTGYWLFSLSPARVLVMGLPPEPSAWGLVSGWNLVGPASEWVVPDPAASEIAMVWEWQPTLGALLRVAPGSSLTPGHGFWLWSGTVSGSPARAVPSR